MQNISIKPITKRDIPILKKLLGFGDRINYRPNSYDERLERQQLESSDFLVAWLAERPVGHISIGWNGTTNPVIKNQVPLSSNPNIFSVLVHPDYRKMGIASEMFDYVETKIASKGYGYAGLAVAMDNSIAEQFYQKRGYRAVKTDPLTSWVEYIDFQGQIVKTKEVAKYLIKKL